MRPLGRVSARIKRALGRAECQGLAVCRRGKQKPCGERGGGKGRLARCRSLKGRPRTPPERVSTSLKDGPCSSRLRAESQSWRFSPRFHATPSQLLRLRRGMPSHAPPKAAPPALPHRLRQQKHSKNTKHRFFTRLKRTAFRRKQKEHGSRLACRAPPPSASGRIQIQPAAWEVLPLARRIERGRPLFN